MAVVHVNGVNLAYDEAGIGPVVVFIHAGIADRRMWEHQFHALSAKHRVIRYDWRGYGESEDASESFAHYEDLLGLMDALGVECGTLVGCSMGGSYAMEVALTAPERIMGLTLICSGLSGHEWPPEMIAQVQAQVHSSVPADRLRRYLNRAVDNINVVDVEAMAEAQARFMVAGPGRNPSEVDPQAWALALSMLRGVSERTWTGPRRTERQLHPPVKERLAEIEAPTLLINGLADVPQIQAVTGLLAKSIPGARRIDLPMAGHLPPLERPVEVTAALKEFLAMSEHFIPQRQGRTNCVPNLTLACNGTSDLS